MHLRAGTDRPKDFFVLYRGAFFSTILPPFEGSCCDAIWALFITCSKADWIEFCVALVPGVWPRPRTAGRSAAFARTFP